MPEQRRQPAGHTEFGRHGRRRPVLAAAESLPLCYPRLESQGILRKSARRRSVRDRGVGGSNPLAPTTFLTKTAKLSVPGHSVPPEGPVLRIAPAAVSPSQWARNFAPLQLSSDGLVDSSRQIATLNTTREGAVDRAPSSRDQHQPNEDDRYTLMRYAHFRAAAEHSPPRSQPCLPCAASRFSAPSLPRPGRNLPMRPRGEATFTNRKMLMSPCGLTPPPTSSGYASSAAAR